jgi:hypothetical protein
VAKTAALREVPGFRRFRWHKVINATTLDQFERIEAEVQLYVALIEFDGLEAPVWRVSEVMGGYKTGDEVGWYRMKRIYE